MKKFFSWLSKNGTPENPEADTMNNLLKKLTLTKTQEISCDDVHAVLAEFAERQHQGEPIAHLMPQVEQHLELCPDCREEYEALLLAIDAEENFT